MFSSAGEQLHSNDCKDVNENPELATKPEKTTLNPEA